MSTGHRRGEGPIPRRGPHLCTAAPASGDLKARAVVPLALEGRKGKAPRANVFPAAAPCPHPVAACRGPSPPGISLHPGLVPTSRTEQVQQARAQLEVSGISIALGRVVGWGAREDLTVATGWARDTRKRHWDSSRPGDRREQPTLHARHVTLARVLLCQTGRPTPVLRVRRREEMQGHPAWDYRENQPRFRFFATGHPPVGRLLRNTNGSISRNFLRQQQTHLGKEGAKGGGGESGGLHWGQRGRGKGAASPCGHVPFSRGCWLLVPALSGMPRLRQGGPELHQDSPDAHDRSPWRAGRGGSRGQGSRSSRSPGSSGSSFSSSLA